MEIHGSLLVADQVQPLVAVTDTDPNLGLLRLALRDAVERLA